MTNIYKKSKDNRRILKIFSKYATLSKVLEECFKKKFYGNRRILKIFSKKCKSSKSPWRMFSYNPRVSKILDKYLQKTKNNRRILKIFSKKGSFSKFFKNIFKKKKNPHPWRMISKNASFSKGLNVCFQINHVFQRSLRNIDKKNWTTIEGSWKYFQKLQVFQRSLRNVSKKSTFFYGPWKNLQKSNENRRILKIFS